MVLLPPTSHDSDSPGRGRLLPGPSVLAGLQVALRKGLHVPFLPLPHIELTLGEHMWRRKLEQAPLEARQLSLTHST